MMMCATGILQKISPANCEIHDMCFDTMKAKELGAVQKVGSNKFEREVSKFIRLVRGIFREQQEHRSDRSLLANNVIDFTAKIMYFAKQSVVPRTDGGSVWFRSISDDIIDYILRNKDFLKTADGQRCLQFISGYHDPVSRAHLAEWKELKKLFTVAEENEVDE